MYKKVVITCLLLGSISGHTEVWNVNNKWDDKAEEEFANYIESLPLNYFQSTYGIGIKPASMAFALRADFSKKNGLPFLMATKKGFVSNLTDEFDLDENNESIDDNKRFELFLEKYITSSSISNLSNSTLPIELSRTNIKPGTLFINLSSDAQDKKKSNVAVVSKLSENGQISFLASPFYPAFENEVTSIERKYYFRTDLNYTNDGGFRAFKKVVFNQEENQVKFFNTKFDQRFSLEQYTSKYITFDFEPSHMGFSNLLSLKFDQTLTEAEMEAREKYFGVRQDIYNAIVNGESTDELKIELSNLDRYLNLKIKAGASEFSDLCASFQARKVLVEFASQKLEEKQKEDPEYIFSRRSDEYKLLSTPVRDGQIAGSYWSLRKLYGSNIKKMANSCIVNVEQDVNVSLSQFIKSRKYKKMRKAMGNPNSSKLLRWGVSE